MAGTCDVAGTCDAAHLGPMRLTEVRIGAGSVGLSGSGRLATNWPARWLIVVRNGSHACLFQKPEPAHAWRGDEDKGPGDSRAICSFLVRMSSRQGAWGTCLE